MSDEKYRVIGNDLFYILESDIEEWEKEAYELKKQRDKDEKNEEII